MEYDEIIGQVQYRAGLSSRRTAVNAMCATLATLAERIPETLAGALVDQLPSEIGATIERTMPYAGRASGESFGFSEFVDRVRVRTGVDRSTAISLARSVFAVIKEAIPETVLERVTVAVPADLRKLIETADTLAITRLVDTPRGVAGHSSTPLAPQ